MHSLNHQNYPYLEEEYEGLLKHIPLNAPSTPKMVLDVACGMGTISLAVQKKGYTVWGIDKNREAAAIAAARIAKVFNADLTNLSQIRDHLGGYLFDFIIFSHILEHIYDPLSIINGYLPFLKDTGRLIISVPNVAVWSNRIKLLLGNFTYTDTGIMDRTHIRFFTLRSATALLRASGCSIVAVDYTPYFVRAFLPLIKRMFHLNSTVRHDNRRKLLDSRAYRWYMRYIYPAEYCLGYLRKSLFAYDLIIVAKKGQSE